MSLVEYTQTRLDNIVSGIAEAVANLADISMRLRSYSDPGAIKMEEDLIALSVFFDSINNYDVTMELLTQNEINDIIEFCILITEKYNIQFQH